MKRMSKGCLRFIVLSTAPCSGKWFHLKRGGLVMNGYCPCWFLHTRLYKQTRLAPVSYKDSSLKVLSTFQVWARLFCTSMHFLVFVFSYLLYECVPCHTGRYQTLSTSGTWTLFWLQKLATLNLHLATKILQLVANDLTIFFNFKPCILEPWVKNPALDWFSAVMYQGRMRWRNGV